VLPIKELYDLFLIDHEVLFQLELSCTPLRHGWVIWTEETLYHLQTELRNLEERLRPEVLYELSLMLTERL
jgi:hypothetical protein